MILQTVQCFNVDITMLYISAMDHAGKLKCSMSLCLSNSVQCRKGYYFQALVLYFSFETY